MRSLDGTDFKDLLCERIGLTYINDLLRKRIMSWTKHSKGLEMSDEEDEKYEDLKEESNTRLE